MNNELYKEMVRAFVLSEIQAAQAMLQDQTDQVRTVSRNAAQQESATAVDALFLVLEETVLLCKGACDRVVAALDSLNELTSQESN